jgi:hypothetical protein
LGTLGVGTIDHVLPLKRSTNVVDSLSMALPELPTATQKVALTHDAALSTTRQLGVAPPHDAAEWAVVDSSADCGMLMTATELKRRTITACENPCPAT